MHNTVLRKYDFLSKDFKMSMNMIFCHYNIMSIDMIPFMDVTWNQVKKLPFLLDPLDPLPLG